MRPCCWWTIRPGCCRWRNDVDGLAALFSNHIPDYRNLITSYSALKPAG